MNTVLTNQIHKIGQNNKIKKIFLLDLISIMYVYMYIIYICYIYEHDNIERLYVYFWNKIVHIQKDYKKT